MAAAKPLTQTTTWCDFETHLQAWTIAHNITELQVMAPNDRPFLQLVQNLQLADQITLCCCWDFLARHRDKLQSIGRMSFILANLDQMPPQELATIRQQAADWHLRSH